MMLLSVLPLSIILSSSFVFRNNKGVSGRLMHRASDCSLLLILHLLTKIFIGIIPSNQSYMPPWDLDKVPHAR